MVKHHYDRNNRLILTRMPAYNHIWAAHEPAHLIDLQPPRSKLGNLHIEGDARFLKDEDIWADNNWRWTNLLDTTRPHEIASKAQKAFKDTKLRRQRAAFARTSFASALPDDLMKRIFDETEEPSAVGLHAMGLQRRAARKPSKRAPRRSHKKKVHRPLPRRQ